MTSARLLLACLAAIAALLAPPAMAAGIASPAGAAGNAPRFCSDQGRAIAPHRPSGVHTGISLITPLAGLSHPARDAALVKAALDGHVPDFLFHLLPVRMHAKDAAGHPHDIVFCTTPDYLSVGTARDFIRLSLGLPGAARLMSGLGMMLPTPRMVDAISASARIHLSPQPLPPGRRMTSVDYLLKHEKRVDAQLRDRGYRAGELIDGQKKDLVMSRRLVSHPGKVAIYGWHRRNGHPIQPLSTVHGAHYADYSHGIRGIAPTLLVDGVARALPNILADPDLCAMLGSGGPIPHDMSLMGRLARL